MFYTCLMVAIFKILLFWHANLILHYILSQGVYVSLCDSNGGKRFKKIYNDVIFLHHNSQKGVSCRLEITHCRSFIRSLCYLLPNPLPHYVQQQKQRCPRKPLFFSESTNFFKVLFCSRFKFVIIVELCDSGSGADNGSFTLTLHTLSCQVSEQKSVSSNFLTSL